MIRKPIIAGNWKMHMTVPEAMELIDGILPQCSGRKDVEVVVAPPFTALLATAIKLKDKGIGLSAQDMHWESKGAFTGEISAPMLVDAGCTHVIIGHSERRQYFGETDATVSKKTAAALAEGLVPIVCVGETLAEREAGDAFKVIERQLEGGLGSQDAERMENAIIAYEPVWAIGTGKTATPDQAQEVHAFIRKWVAGKFGVETAAFTPILYGGSVKPDNVKDLMSRDDIDGALVGGASLKADLFVALVNFSK